MCSLVWQCTDYVSWSVVLLLGVLTCGGNGGRWIGTCVGIRWGCVNDNDYILMIINTNMKHECLYVF
jgi:hypothetical protein